MARTGRVPQGDGSRPARAAATGIDVVTGTSVGGRRVLPGEWAHRRRSVFPRPRPLRQGLVVGSRPMARAEKTVFISYRRTNVAWALAVFQNLKHEGYDVFFDFQGIASGDFETVILENVRTRAHFVVLLTPSALKRCSEPGDWLRREIETAL